MFISIKKDGSIYIESTSFIASYNEQGKLNYSIGGSLNVPEFININDHREKKSPNPAKDESSVKPIKITVDSTDLDKLEAQLKRIEGLMVSTGLKQPAQQGFTIDFGIFNPKGCLEPVFTVSSGTILINEAGIEHATIEKIVLPSEEHTEKALASSAAVLRTSEAIATEQSAFEKLQQLIEDKFNYLHSSITAIQHTQANSEIASSNAIEQVRAEIQRKEPLDL